MTDETDISTANTMRERSGESRIKLGMLLRANRLLVASILTSVLFVAFVIVVTVLHPPFSRQIESGDMIDTMFSTMITVIVTGTTLVVTIGQLVLTQENGPFGDQRERMASSMDSRDFTEESIGAPSPVDPSEFLRQIIGTTAQRATALRESIGENADEDLRDEVDEFAESVTGNADTVRDQLECAQFGSFDVLFVALNFNYCWKIVQVERLANEYEESLNEEEDGLLNDFKTACLFLLRRANTSRHCTSSGHSSTCLR